MKKLIALFATLIILMTTTVTSLATHSYNDLVEGKGTPLILIHAFPTDQSLWVPQIQGLKPYFKVITLNLKGFGHNNTTDGKAITMDEYATQVKNLLDKLHVKKAIIGGESMGGYVALAFLKEYPQMVDGLILSDTQSTADDAVQRKNRKIQAATVLKDGSQRYALDIQHKLLSTDASNQTKHVLNNILTDQSPSAIASALRGMALREDLSGVLAKTKVPVLIMVGDNDKLIPLPHSEMMHELAPNSRLVIIKHSGHLSSLEQPNQWNQAVVNMFYKKKTS